MFDVSYPIRSCAGWGGRRTDSLRPAQLILQGPPGVPSGRNLRIAGKACPVEGSERGPICTPPEGLGPRDRHPRPRIAAGIGEDCGDK